MKLNIIFTLTDCTGYLHSVWFVPRIATSFPVDNYARDVMNLAEVNPDLGC